ncbi:NADH dehydrogenase (ubiquinone) complex I, assembly factor 6 homolog isoform X1 [Maniola hyperantus]|uniref:NADH dehydrogenase (ubiquinone) complex I, assembly factor 6 homolog isoform X1 n=2 Tax=Aphantopus hyperantus TaxID=2795564 RepID=UPI00156A07D4|nr:NADH dehydrogenase (ubiquinone) complex I, assembly factor 6 homolog isoform X1 [Maniola hyperantus]
MILHLKYPYSAYKSLRRLLTQQASSSLSENSLNYCATIVRQHDYENYLATLLMTKALRSPALVVRAFNAEIARVQDQTTDPQTAAMRLQFWQDAMGVIYDKQNANIPANPVTQELNKICATYKLPKRYIERLISSRAGLLKTKYFKSLEDVEAYTENTVSTIYYLLLCIAGVANVHADHAASHLGKAQGLVNILRSVHISNYHKTICLPMEVLMKYKVSQQAVLRGTDNENMRNVVFEIASRAKSHLEKARKIEVPKICNQIFLPAIAVDKYLTKLQKKNFNVFDKSLQLGSPMLPLSLYYKRLLNKY